MASKKDDKKLKDTLLKHEFSEDAAQNIESKENKKIQSIFDKSRSEDDTAITKINLNTSEQEADISFVTEEDSNEKHNTSGIIIDIPDIKVEKASEVELDLSEENLDLGEEDEKLDLSGEHKDISLNDDIGESLDFRTENEPSMDTLDEKNNSLSIKFGDVDSENTDSEEKVSEEVIEEATDKEENLFDALNDAQDMENEFPVDSEEEDVSLDDLYDDVKDDVLSETVVDIDQKSLMEEIKNKDNEFESSSSDVEATVIDNQVLQNENNDEFESTDFVDDAESEQSHKEFGFDTLEKSDMEDDFVDDEKTTKLFDQSDESEEKRVPSQPHTLDSSEEDLDETKITSFNQKELSPEDQTRITKKQIPEKDVEVTTYGEMEMLKHQTTIRMLKDDRQGLLDEIDKLKEQNQRYRKDNISIKAEFDEIQIELTIIRKRHDEDINELRYNLNYSEDKKKFLTEKLKKNQDELGHMGNRVRVDLEQLRRKEKELENQLELVQMDTANQVQNRENKILELKRKIDALEYNMENTVMKEQQAREDKQKLEERLRSIMKTLRGSIRLLEEDLDLEDELIKHSRDM